MEHAILQPGDVATWQGEDGHWRLVWMLARDEHEKLGAIYSLAQFILMMDDAPQQLTPEELDSLRETERLGHFPITAESLQQTGLEVVGHLSPNADDMEGYRVWREAFDRGEAGVFSVPLEEIWGMVLETLAQSSRGEEDGDE